VPGCRKAWHSGPAGVREHGERPVGSPSNRRGLPSSLVPYVGSGGAEPETPGLSRLRLGAAGAKTQTQGGIAGRAQEHGETGRQESEPLLVPRKSGNPCRGDPAEGRGGRVTGPRSGNKGGH
jgi:hypothetical protein